MADVYYCAGQAGYPGPWAANATEARNNPNRPGKAIDIRTWLQAGSIVSGDTVEVLGQYPLKLVDAQDFTAAAFGVAVLEAPNDQTPLQIGASGNRPRDLAPYYLGRMIIWGDDSDNASGSPSKATGVNFRAVGFDPTTGYNVDMRGGTSNTDRQSFALLFQGYDMDIGGFRVRSADRNPIATGRVPATAGIGGSAALRYPSAASEENGAIWVRGGWGCNVHDCQADGGTFGFTGMLVEYKAITATPTLNQNKLIDVYDNEVWSFGEQGINVQAGSGMDNTTCQLPYGAVIRVRNNVVHDAFWGDPSWNAAWIHGNLIRVNGVAHRGCIIRVYGNELYGDCQDGFAVLGSNVHVYENYIHNLSLSKTINVAATYFYGVDADGTNLAGYAVGWNTRPGITSEVGNGVKVGLGTSYEGTPGSDWATYGTTGGTFAVPELFNFVYRNTIDDFSGFGVTGNGCSGLFVHANRIRSTRGWGITGGGDVAANSNMFVSHNYVECPRALDIRQFYNVWAFNNVFKGSTNSVFRSGANSTIRGSHNVLDGAVSGTNNLFNSTVATAAYDWDTGPTPGGNCDGAGTPLVFERARCAPVWRDISGRLFKSGKVPIGARALH